MVDNNGNIKQSVFYQEMKELRKDIENLRVDLTAFYSGVDKGATERMNLKDAIASLSEWKDKTEERIDALESKDKRFVALIGAGAAVISSVVTLVAHLLLGA